MKFAYLILCHKNPSQLTDLIDTLQDGSNYFFVHVDNKVDIVPFVKYFFFTKGTISTLLSTCTKK